MHELTDFIDAYHKLSYSDRVVFYSTVSNDVHIDRDNVQSFLIETRMTDKHTCLHRGGIM